MASRGLFEGAPLYVEEIDVNEIEEYNFNGRKDSVIGRGSFGEVRRCMWRGKIVAVKYIDSEVEKLTPVAAEVRQLSRVRHSNIVTLYGACSDGQRICLVMEYAECGSLYDLLHGKPLRKYTAGHAMSWALQCAKGVAYLHSMKPKPVIHRDLKPPNLLLVSGGTVLKICDFGTACDKTTCMTNNKGSAAWMAPEVFETTKYTEKCDVFSWGIILWEVLSRRKPFDDLHATFSILWAKHTGKRPPLIEGCPKPIEKLYTSCWDGTAANRPSMETVVRIMTQLFSFFSGHDQIIDEFEDDDQVSDQEVHSSADDTDATSKELDAYYDSVRNSDSSCNNHTFTNNDTLEKYSKPLQIHVDPPINNGKGEDTNNNSEEVLVQAGTGLDIPVIKPPVINSLPENENFTKGGSSVDDNKWYLMLDPQLQPVPPDESCHQSMQIFQEHKNLAQEYFRVTTQIAYLSNQMRDLAERLSVTAEDQQEDEEVRKLESEKESLVQLHRNLTRQLQLLKGRRGEQRPDDSQRTNAPTEDGGGGAGGGWVYVPNIPPTHTPNPTHPT
ncbi:mitogen-activated protein kinase kinase kinase 7 [Nilaparvata lugens]|uniref:mitogen-activated protein kinase kinase kinase 7 n=1 Tax=Nilaparvata lugens TaxID=108931 RepID=UPI000B98FDB9|nr:mitogen-activated protein kinase kinase kinase 7 [Nilaparvata lugens]